MKKILFVVLSLLLLSAAPAYADHADNWTANQDSFVVNETTVHLEGDNTSVETGELFVVSEGETVTFEYTLHEGAECVGTSIDLRVFLIINGNNTNSWTQLHPEDKQCGEDGLVTFVTEDAGLITQAGVVIEGEEGYVEVSNLTIGDELIHFMNPEPEVCEYDDELLASDDECVKPTPKPTPTKTATEEPTPKPSPTETATPVAKEQEELPATGLPVGILIAGGVVLIGSGLLIRKLV